MLPYGSHHDVARQSNGSPSPQHRFGLVLGVETRKIRVVRKF